MKINDRVKFRLPENVLDGKTGIIYGTFGANTMPDPFFIVVFDELLENIPDRAVVVSIRSLEVIEERIS